MLAVEARRLVRVSPLLRAYLRNMLRNVVCSEPEAPMFAESVPERTAAAAAELWLRHHHVDVERDRLHRVITDGEFLLIGDEPGDLDLVPCDGFEPVDAGPEWHRTVTGYKVGKGATVRRESDTLIYIGERVEGEARGAAVGRAGTPLCGGAGEHANQRRARTRGGGEDYRGDRKQFARSHRRHAGRPVRGHRWRPRERDRR